jgi:hypothetical protein
MLDWTPVTDSDRVVAVAYDVETETIYARFPDGVEWHYAACPPHVWEEFCQPGTSKGRYIHQVLNGKPNGKHIG